MKTITKEIPAEFYAYGTPYRTHYMDEDAEGLAYKISPEQEYQERAATGRSTGWRVVSLLSPYVLGWDFGYKAYELELVGVDVQARKVTVKIK